MLLLTKVNTLYYNTAVVPHHHVVNENFTQGKNGTRLSRAQQSSCVLPLIIYRLQQTHIMSLCNCKAFANKPSAYLFFSFNEFELAHQLIPMQLPTHPNCTQIFRVGRKLLYIVSIAVSSDACYCLYAKHWKIASVYVPSLALSFMALCKAALSTSLIDPLNAATSKKVR